MSAIDERRALERLTRVTRNLTNAARLGAATPPAPGDDETPPPADQDQAPETPESGEGPPTVTP